MVKHVFNTEVCRVLEKSAQPDTRREFNGIDSKSTPILPMCQCHKNLTLDASRSFKTNVSAKYRAKIGSRNICCFLRPGLLHLLQVQVLALSLKNHESLVSNKS